LQLLVGRGDASCPSDEAPQSGRGFQLSDCPTLQGCFPARTERFIRAGAARCSAQQDESMIVVHCIWCRYPERSKKISRKHSIKETQTLCCAEPDEPPAIKYFGPIP